MSNYETDNITRGLLNIHASKSFEVNMVVVSEDDHVSISEGRIVDRCNDRMDKLNLPEKFRFVRGDLAVRVTLRDADDDTSNWIDHGVIVVENEKTVLRHFPTHLPFRVLSDLGNNETFSVGEFMMKTSGIYREALRDAVYD